jgi:hypothetical protein
MGIIFRDRPPPDNGEPLSKLRRRCQALCKKKGRYLPPNATRGMCLDILDMERRYQAICRRRGRRLPPGSTFAECLLALANRIEVDTEGYDPQSYTDFRPPFFEGGPWGSLWETVGEQLIFAQPEFWTAMGAPKPGRPPGAENKQLNPKPEPEALRQRHRRQKKRDKNSS